MCDCCNTPVADLIGLARSTGAKRCPPPPPSPFASPSVKCRVRGGGLHRWVCVCSRPLGPRSYSRHVCARALWVHAFLRRVSARALSVHAIQSVSIFPRPHATHPDRGRDEILLILPSIHPHPLVPTPAGKKWPTLCFLRGDTWHGAAGRGPAVPVGPGLAEAAAATRCGARLGGADRLKL